MKHHSIIRKIFSLTLTLVILTSIFGANAFVVNANPNINNFDPNKPLPKPTVPQLEKKIITVKFDPNLDQDGINKFNEMNADNVKKQVFQSVLLNEKKIIEPKVPQIEGKVFEYWKYGIKEVDFTRVVILKDGKWHIPTVNGEYQHSSENIRGTTINGDNTEIEIIAQWKIDPILKLRFFTNNNSLALPSSIQTLHNGENIGNVTVTPPANKTLKGWKIRGDANFDGYMVDTSKNFIYELDDDDYVSWKVPLIDSNGNTTTKDTTPQESTSRILALEAIWEDVDATDNNNDDDNNPTDDNNPANDDNPTEQESYTLTFDTDGGEPVPEPQVLSNEKAVKPEDPSKDGYKFIGWFDGDMNRPFDFNNPIRDTFTLTAKYEKINEATATKRNDLKISAEDYDKAIIEYTEPFIKGYPNGTFGPSFTITRAEMSTVFARILGIQNKPLDGTAKFSDISGHWAEDNILRLAEYGLLNGYPDGSFKPDKTMSKSEITSIIAKYWKNKDFTPNTADTEIKDIKNHWSKDNVNALYNHGFVNIYKSRFHPDDPLKREDVALILNRLTDRPAKNFPQQFTDVPSSHWLYNEINTAANSAE